MSDPRRPPASPGPTSSRVAGAGADRVDLVVRGALVLSGTGTPGVVTDVAVHGDRIVAVGAVTGRGRTEVPGHGLVLAPGFIDVHTHDDWALLQRPEHECKVLQGVTSVVTGNCGTSPAPIGPAEVTGGAECFPTHAAYLARLDADPASVNVATLVGHGAVRAAVVGLRADRAPTAAETAAMEAHVDEALEAGAVGLSTGLAYEPGRYATTDEVVGLARRAAAAGGLYTTHLRDEAGGLLPAVDEAIRIGREAGIAVQISHHKAAGRANWGRVADSLARIEQARRLGIDVLADQYPYTRGSTLLEQVVRSGALTGPSPFGRVAPEGVLVAAAPRHPQWEGRTLAELAGDAGVDPLTMAARMVEAEGRTCFVVIDMMSEDDVRRVLAHPTTMIGSDGVPAGSTPHPRLYHTFPRVLGRYARDEGVLDLPTAVHRMTAMPARRFGLVDRGVVRPGAFADLVLFDPATVADTGTYLDPASVPAGIAGVWVNGTRVADHGVHTGARPGRTLRRPG